MPSYHGNNKINKYIKMKKCCWDNCELPRKGKVNTILIGQESSYRYCEYHYPIMKRNSRYNLNKYELEEILQKTNCDLCGRLFNRSKKEPKVDHCHTTGIVRGVLCSSCNTGLGLLGDNTDSLIKAIKYLNKKII
jgi:hypothetical protein